MSLTYLVDNGDGTDQATSTNPREGRVIGIQFGAVPQLRSVRGRGVTTISKCGHPSMRFGLCILAPGHPGCHAFAPRETPEATRSAPTRCAEPEHVKQARAALNIPTT